MLNVITACVGDAYGLDYVKNLNAMVSRHLKQEHTFIMFGDNPDFPAPPSWWHKLRAFGPEAPEGQILVLDLDQVILKDLDDLLDACDPNVMTCYADHIEWCGTRFGSAFMYFPSGKYHKVYDAFMTEPDFIREEYDKRGGDQAFIGEMIPEAQYLEDLLGYRPVLSYKFDGLDQEEPDPDTYIVNFHGRPKPHEAEAPWVLEHWQ